MAEGYQQVLFGAAIYTTKYCLRGLSVFANILLRLGD